MNNRYSMARHLSNFILDLSNKYNIINNANGTNVQIIFEKHLCDRILDRSVSVEIVSTCITRLIRDNVCQLIYLIELEDDKRINLNINGYMFGCVGVKTLNGNYKVKLTTVYKERPNRKRIIPHNTLILKEKTNGDNKHQIP